MSNPITPAEVKFGIRERIPDDVIDVFNALISANWTDSGNGAFVKQEDVLAALVHRGYVREFIFRRHLLDVEDIYRSAGWHVYYDKPVYNEPGDAGYIFKAGTLQPRK
jgi:hypothetical protein